MAATKAIVFRLLACSQCLSSLYTGITVEPEGMSADFMKDSGAEKYSKAMPRLFNVFSKIGMKIPGRILP
jgi:hypothetical protein